MRLSGFLPRAAHALALFCALAGGALILGLVAMTVVSVLGRAGLTLGHGWSIGLLQRLGPVRGDYELIELGTAIAVFSFLPLSVWHGVHARVTLLPWARLDRLWDGVMALVLAVIAVQLGRGMVGKLVSGESSFLLGLPVWWGFAGALIGAWAAVLVALVRVFCGGAASDEERAA